MMVEPHVRYQSMWLVSELPPRGCEHLSVRLLVA